MLTICCSFTIQALKIEDENVLEPFESTHLQFNSINYEWVTSPAMETDPPRLWFTAIESNSLVLRGTRVIPGEETQYGTLYYSWVLMFMWVHLESWNVKPHLHLKPTMGMDSLPPHTAHDHKQPTRTERFVTIAGLRSTENRIDLMNNNKSFFQLISLCYHVKTWSAGRI